MNVEYKLNISSSRLNLLRDCHSKKLQQTLFHYQNALNIKEKIDIFDKLKILENNKKKKNNCDYVYHEFYDINSKDNIVNFSNISTYGMSIIPEKSEIDINNISNKNKFPLESVNNEKLDTKLNISDDNLLNYKSNNRSLLNPYTIDKSHNDLNCKTMILNILDIDDIEENHYNLCDYNKDCKNNKIEKKKKIIIQNDDIEKENFSKFINSKIVNIKVDHNQNVIKRKILKKYFSLLISNIKSES